MEIFHDFGGFFATRIRFIAADLGPADQNETDPNESGSGTLPFIQCFESGLSYGPYHFGLPDPGSNKLAKILENHRRSTKITLI